MHIMHNRIIMSAVLLLLLLSRVIGQTQRVVADNQGAIAGATVEVWDSYPDGRVLTTYKTDENGVFQLSDIPSEFDVRVYSEWYFPLVYSSSQISDTLFLEHAPTIQGSMQYLEYWSTDSFFHGYPVQQGDVITAVDPDSIVCGVTYVKYFESDNVNGFLIAVYGDVSLTSDVDEGAQQGDTIRFFINKEEAVPRNKTPVWYSGGSVRIELNRPGVLSLTTEILPDPSYGKIVVTPDTNRIPYGINVSLQAVPSFGYKFVYWDNAELDTTRDMSFVITSDTLVRAYFSKLSALPLHIAMQYPDNNFKNVPVNIPISLKIRDEIYGVNLSSVSMTVNEKTVLQNGESQVGDQVFVQPVDSGYQIKYVTENNFTPNSSVQVIIDAASKRKKNPSQIHEVYYFITGSASLSSIELYKVKAGVEIRRQGHPLGIVFDSDSDFPDSIAIGDVINTPSISDSLRPGLHSLFFGPFGFVSDNDFLFLFHYSDSLLQAYGVHSPEDLSLLFYQPESGEWNIIPPYNVDRGNKIVRYSANTLSYVQLVSIKPQIERASPSGKSMIYNYPNPFNPDISPTFVRFKLPVNSVISAKIIDVEGNVVRIIERDKNCLAGVIYQCQWDGKDTAGRVAANNVYYCVITGSNLQSIVRKIAVIR